MFYATPVYFFVKRYVELLHLLRGVTTIARFKSIAGIGHEMHKGRKNTTFVVVRHASESWDEVLLQCNFLLSLPIHHCLGEVISNRAYYPYP